ncbi:MAG: ABC transporter permease [Phycisphaerae bacterium]|nr:ABC transporter permease [Gemmatimonadaceae bacterium]
MFARRANEQRMHEEMQLHIELETQRLMRESKLSMGEARRLALVAFGGVEQHKEHVREGLGIRWASGLSLDLKLGFRMLLKYPGLTLIGCLALSVAIAASASYHEMLHDLYESSLDVDDGDRMVMIQNWDTATRERDPHVLHDYLRWRNELKRVHDLGAFQSAERNLIAGDGNASPVKGVLTTAAAFRLMHVLPLIGRTLLQDDEQPGTLPAVVLGYRVWKSQFGADSQVLGKTVRWGGETFTVAGVMPEGFSFPATEELWVPFRHDRIITKRGDGPPIYVYGRLADGATLRSAQAELDAIFARDRATLTTEQQNRKPMVKGYLGWILKSGSSEDEVTMQVAYWLNLFFVGLLAVCGANVATLVFARTATRANELSIRTALGASRGRIMAQLGAEALVLSSLAAFIALIVAYFAMRWSIEGIMALAGELMPFWWNFSLSSATLVYTAVLTVFAALVVGVLPAYKATGGQLHSRLKRASAGGASMKFGGLWTGIIVTQVGLTVFFLFIVAAIGWNVRVGRYLPAQVALQSANILTARVGTEEEKRADGTVKPLTDDSRVRFDAAYLRLKQHLLAQDGVTGVTYASQVPGAEMRGFRIEVEGQSTENDSERYVRTAGVDPLFMETVGATLLTGRNFNDADTASGRNVAIIDQSLAQYLFRGGNAIGQRVREVRYDGGPKPGEWTEIVGVVRDLTTVPDKAPDDAMIYRPTAPSRAYPAYLTVRTTRDAAALSQSLRRVAAEAEPSLRLYDVLPLSEMGKQVKQIFGYLVRVLILLGLVAILLSTAGVYSLMAFTVARRRREIGIRVALGADSRRIVRAVFSPALRQVGLGVLLGSVPGVALVSFGAPEVARGGGVVIGVLAFAGVGLFVMGVGAVACFVPVRRALGIQPTEALSAAD